MNNRATRPNFQEIKKLTFLSPMTKLILLSQLSMVVGVFIWTLVGFYIDFFAVPAAMLILHGTIHLLKRSFLKDQAWIWMIGIFFAFLSIIFGTFLLIGIGAILDSPNPFDWSLLGFVLSEIVADSVTLNQNLGSGFIGMIVYSVFYIAYQLANSD